MPTFKRLTAAEASTLSRDELLDRIEAEQAYWHRRMDRGQIRAGDDAAYREFTRIMHAALDPANGLRSALRLVRDGHDDGYWDAGPDLPTPSDPPPFDLRAGGRTSPPPTCAARAAGWSPPPGPPTTRSFGTAPSTSPGRSR